MKSPMQDLLEDLKKLTDRGTTISNQGSIMLVESALKREDDFLKKIIEDAILYALDEDGHTGEWKLKFAKEYYEKYKNNQK